MWMCKHILITANFEHNRFVLTQRNVNCGIETRYLPLPITTQSPSEVKTNCVCVCSQSNCGSCDKKKSEPTNVTQMNKIQISVKSKYAHFGRRNSKHEWLRFSVLLSIILCDAIMIMQQWEPIIIQ